MAQRLVRRIRNNILVGLIIVTPLAVTAFIVNWLFKLLVSNSFVLFLTGSLLRMLPETLRDSRHEQHVVHGIAVLLIILALFMVGFVVRSFFGKKLYALGELILSRIPVVNKIYIYIRQISEGFLAQRQSVFNEVVLVPYPRKGLYSVAFVTAEIPPVMHGKFGEDNDRGPFVSLFIPTTPNPTSGLMIIAPRADLQTLSLTVADAMKLVVSAGAVHPDTELVDDRPTLIDKLEHWLARDGKAEDES